MTACGLDVVVEESPTRRTKDDVKSTNGLLRRILVSTQSSDLMHFRNSPETVESQSGLDEGDRDGWKRRSSA